MQARRIYLFCLFTLGLLFSLVCIYPPKAIAQSRTFYVSRNGANADGLSWTSAWNELDQIDWNTVQPGDTILIDGGSTDCNRQVVVSNTSNTPVPVNCGMVYETTLKPAKNGTSLNPISMQLASDPGRNGTVRIFGGRSLPLPYCGQSGYTLPAARLRGIDGTGVSYVTIDGTKWSGIMMYGHYEAGVYLNSTSRNITVKNVEIFDNGRVHSDPTQNQKGVALSGQQITFENALIHDNGADAFASGGGVANFTLKNSWLYNERQHPTQPLEPFNECTHSDGIQIFSGGVQKGILVEDTIIGPGFMQGMILGDHLSCCVATIQDVTIRNTLFVSHHGDSANAGLITKYESSINSAPPTNYTFDRVTVVRDINTCLEAGQPADNCQNATWRNIIIHGSGHTITNSVFYGGTYLTVLGGPATSNNYNYGVVDENNIAAQVNPNFVDNNFSGIGSGFADFDFTIQNPSIQSAGSRITKPQDLFDSASPQPSATPVVGCLTIAANQGWINNALTAYSSDFTSEFDVVPLTSSMDGVVSLSNGLADSYDDMAATVRFNTNGQIDARNGSVYTAQSIIPYATGTRYHFRLVVDVVAHTYSIYVTPENGTERVVGTNYTFRTEQLNIVQLNNWAAFITGDFGSFHVCNFTAAPLDSSDINKDGKLDFQDGVAIIISWFTFGSTTYDQREDVDQNGIVNALDFGRFIQEITGL